MAVREIIRAPPFDGNRSMLSPIQKYSAYGCVLAMLFVLCAALALRTAHATPPDPSVVRHGYEYYEIGHLKAPRPADTEPALMLMGGGDWPDKGFAWFAAKGGHGHFLILRASGDDDMQKDLYTKIGGVASVQTLVFHSRAAASDPKVLDIVRHADGIFIAGGDQSNYVNFWKGTPLNKLLNEHVAHGKPIGGTSAGLAILGDYGYGAMDGGSITSKEAMHDPLGKSVTLVGDFMHLPNMQHVITDTHFNIRGRLGRLVAFIANLRHAGHVDIIGLGVDQGAALCVDGNGVGHVFTIDNGFAWLVRPSGQPSVAPGRPLEYAGIRVTGIGTQGAIDLRHFTVTRPAFEATVDVHEGELKIHGKLPPARR
jgi:beta-aspartyl-peptidase (threonine type)